MIAAGTSIIAGYVWSTIQPEALSKRPPVPIPLQPNNVVSCTDLCHLARSIGTSIIGHNNFMTLLAAREAGLPSLAAGRDIR